MSLMQSNLKHSHTALAECPSRVAPFRASGRSKSELKHGQFPRTMSPNLRSSHIRSAGPDDKDEPLPWERNERLKALSGEKGELPFGVYLLGASIIAIAAVGSIFEIINQNPIFGVVPPSSPFWLPILGFFGVTGLPSAVFLVFFTYSRNAGFLFIKAINSANAESDRQNKADGY